MKKILKTIDIIKDENEYRILINEELLNKKIEEVLSLIHLENKDEYIVPNNDNLEEELMLRIIVEIIKNKLDMEINKPYIFTLTLTNSMYRLVITKIETDNKTKYMYGLILR